jgi:hypothetical protein
MQTFIVKVTGSKMPAKDIKEAIWVSGELSREDIIVEEIL